MRSGRRWGMFACAAVACVQTTCALTERKAAPPPVDILLITIDTFRADRLGTGVAPALDRLAAASTQFTAARAAVPLTLPSHTTILTGLLPPAHGVRENGRDVLTTPHATVATQLKVAGYQTAAFVGAFVLDRRFGLAQGFDTYDDRIPRDPQATDRLEAERPAAAVIDRAVGWLEQHAAAPGAAAARPAPFFVWVHLYDPHAPYTPPPEFRARTRSPYDGEIAYADAQVARLLDWMRTHGAADRLMIVVAGDHGEGLGDHDERTHGMLLYDSTLRVPLIVAAPGRASARRDDAVSLADVAPTILRAAGLAPTAEMKGRDLLADGAGQEDLYSETEYPRVAGWTPLQALTDGRWKAIRAGSSTQLFDLRADPGETHDVAHGEGAVATALTRTIDRIYAAGAAATTRTVSREAEERLRALGYVGGSGQPATNPNGANPAAKIAAWNAFEDALASLTDKRPVAAAALQRLASENPDAEIFQTTYARALNDAGRPDRALQVYRTAAARWPADAVLLHDLAVAARDAADRVHGAAAAALKHEAARADAAAVVLAPDNAPAHNALGLMAIDDNRPQEAAAAFERAASIDPNNASYWANLGNARRAAGDAAAAERAYRKALDVDPQAADAANGVGVLLVEAHHAVDAVPWFERAIEAAPDLVEARLNLGIALEQSGNVTRAAEEYRRVLSAPTRYKRERDAAAALLTSLGARR